MRLFELSNHDSIMKFQSQLELSHYLRQRCVKSLHLFIERNKVLYRGINRLYSTPNMFVAESPLDRSPKDSTHGDQQMIDDLLTAGNFKALRSNSIFCSGSINATNMYGHKYMIFPIDPFDFTYAEDISDLFSDVSEPQMNGWGRSYEKNIESTSKKFISHYKFKNDSYMDAVYSGNEVYVHWHVCCCRCVGRIFVISFFKEPKIGK